MIIFVCHYLHVHVLGRIFASASHAIMNAHPVSFVADVQYEDTDCFCVQDDTGRKICAPEGCDGKPKYL